MDARSSTSSSERWPRAALAALLLALVFESGVVALRDPLSTGLERIARLKREQLTSLPPAPRAVIFGDSRLYSMDPAAVDAALGGATEAGIAPALNLAWPYLGLEGPEILLAVYTRYQPPPRALVLDLPPEFLGVDERMVSLRRSPAMRVRLYSVAPAGALLPYLIREGEWRILGDWFAYHALPPSARRRERLLMAAQSVLQGRPRLGPLARERRFLEQYEASGSFRLYEEQQLPVPCVQRFEENNGPLGAPARPAALASVERFFDQAAALGAPVILVNPHQPLSLCDRYRERGIQDAYAALLREWQATHPNLAVAGLDAPGDLLPCLPDDHFGDEGHLNARGDAVFQAYYPEVLRGLAGR